MSKVRVGIIGAGNIAGLHARGYANAPNAELRAVCDANGDRARERAAQWGAAKSYTDYRDLLDDPEVDAVDARLLHSAHRNLTGVRRTLILAWHRRPLTVPAGQLGGGDPRGHRQPRPRGRVRRLADSGGVPRLKTGAGGHVLFGRYAGCAWYGPATVARP